MNDYSVIITRWFDKIEWWPILEGVSLIRAKAEVRDRQLRYGNTVGMKILQKIGKGHYRPLEGSTT